MPLQPVNSPAPAIQSGFIRVWDFVNTLLYTDVSIANIAIYIEQGSFEERLHNLKQGILESLESSRPAYTWYGNYYQALINNKSRIHLVHTKGSGPIGKYVFSTQNSGGPGWTEHTLYNMSSTPQIAAGGTHNSFQSGDEFKLIYLNPNNVRLDVSGFKDTTNWFNLYPERRIKPGFCQDWTEYNGTYAIVEPITTALQFPYQIDGTEAGVNNSGIGWKWWGSQNDPYYYSNPSIKKLKWETFLGEGEYGWRKAEVNWQSGRYVLREHTYFDDSSHRHEYKIIATSPPPALAFPYNEDMILPSMLKWTPINAIMGTAGYITVNSTYDPMIPAPLPKGVRLGGGLTVKPNSKIKFKF